MAHFISSGNFLMAFDFHFTKMGRLSYRSDQNRVTRELLFLRIPLWQFMYSYGLHTALLAWLVMVDRCVLKKSKLEQSPPLGKKDSPTMFLWSCDLTPRAKLQWVKKWLQACVVCRVTNHSGLPRIKKFFSNTGLSALQLGHFLANYFDLVTLEMGQTGRVWKLGHES